jgi:hypothetical protein
MRRLFAIVVMLFAAQSAFAQGYPQTYAEQTYPVAPNAAPAYEQGNVYAGQPTYAPQPHYPQPQPAPQAPARTPQPGEYGQSVITDIRQMNF